MIELEHSPLGGSGAKRWLNCAGSFLLHRELLETGEFEDTPSAYADKGTAAHELGALCLLEEREPFEFIGKEIAGYVVGAEDGIDLDAVAIYVNQCEAIWPRDGKGTVLIEQTLKHPDVHPLLKGTIDFGYWSAKRGIYLVDYKNGEGVGVWADRNEQLLYYAFLIVLEYAWLKDGPKDLPVHLAISQANFHGIFNEQPSWTTTLGEVLDWGYNVLLPRMNELTATQDVGPEDFVSGDWCQFCPVMLECPKLASAFKTYAHGTEFVEMLSNEELADLYRLKDDARRFGTALENTVKARLIGGSDIPTAKLVATRTNRAWKEGAADALKAQLGDACLSKPELLSPAQVEKLSSRGKALALEYGYMPESSSYSVALASDPRPGVKPPSNADTFAAYAKGNDLEGF